MNPSLSSLHASIERVENMEAEAGGQFLASHLKDRGLSSVAEEELSGPLTGIVFLHREIVIVRTRKR